MITTPLVATVIILLIAFVGFATSRIPAAVVALGVALSLWATGVITLPEAFAGFANPTVVFVAAMFVVSEAIDATGITARVGRFVVERAGSRPTRPLVLLMVIQSMLCAVLSVSGTVATMLPVAVIIATRLAIPPSRLLLPALYATHAGSMLVLTGTPVNMIVSQLALESTGSPFSFFEFAAVGAPLVAGTVLLTVLLRPRLLPDQDATSAPRDLDALTESLVHAVHGDGTVVRVRIPARSTMIGASGVQQVAEAAPDVQVLAVREANGRPKALDSNLAAGDLLTLRAERSSIDTVIAALALIEERPRSGGSALVDGRVGLAEFVIAPRSSLIGVAAFPGMLAGHLVLLTIHRNGLPLDDATTTLAVGDVLVLHGSWEALDAAGADPDLLPVEDAAAIRRQISAPIDRRGWTALGILVAMVILLSTGTVPEAVATLLAAGALVVLRIVPIERAIRSVSWTTVILVAGLIPVSTAFAATGLDDIIGSTIVALAGPGGAPACLAAMCLVVIILGQVMSNTATVLLIAPVAISMADALEVSVLPFLMALTVAGAAALLTPIATPANHIVQQAGRYRFADFARFGAPFALLYLVVASLLVPVVWPF